MIGGGRFVFQSRDGGSAVERAEGIGISAAGDEEVDCCLTSNSGSARRRHGAAIIVQWISRDWVKSSTDRLAGQVRVLAQRRGIQLVNIALAAEMRSLAADIGGCQDNVTRQFVLDVQVPLLHVRP